MSFQSCVLVDDVLLEPTLNFKKLCFSWNELLEDMYDIED